jgi:phosphonate transport system substrate-binding protein
MPDLLSAHPRRWLACLFLLGLPWQAMAFEYRFSPVNQYGVRLTAEYWNPIIDYVSGRSGIKLTLKMGRTSADTFASVLAGEVDIIFSNHFFSPEREKLGWRVIARRNTGPVTSQIVVPLDAPIRDLTELAGGQVAFVGPEAVVGYRFPYAHLLSRQIDVRPVFAGNAEAALSRMFAGGVQAAGLNSQVIESYARREGKAYRVLWHSEPLHDLAVMVSAVVPERDAQLIAQAFAEMSADPRGREILQRASRLVARSDDDGFVQSDGREYGAYRAFYRTAPAFLR